MDCLCPEMKETFLKLGEHFKSCDKCRYLLASYGAMYQVIEGLNIVPPPLYYIPGLCGEHIGGT